MTHSLAVRRVPRRHLGLLAVLVPSLGIALVMTATPAAWASATPGITSIDPGAARRGAAVTVHGADLLGATAVTLAGEAMAFSVVDDATLTAVVPADGASGTLQVTTPDGPAVANSPLNVLLTPAPPTAATARPGHGIVDLGWTGGGSAGVLVRALVGPTAPASSTDGREVFRGAGTGVRDSGLVDGSTYSYAIWSLDSDGTTSESAALTSGVPVPQPATLLHLAPPAAAVGPGGILTLAGRLTLSDGTALPREQLTVTARTLGTSAVSRLGSVTTALDGRYSYAVAPRVSAEYQLHYPGSLFGAPSDSEKVTSHLRPRLTAGLSLASIVLGNSSAVRGVLTPAYAGARLSVQQHLADGWHTLANLGTSGGGGYAAPLQPGSVGTLVYRVVLAGTAAYDAATSPSVTLRVDPRDLQLGDQGPDVLALEQRLSDLRFHQSPPDGVFGPDTLHALTAFQKLAGLPRTGAYDGATRARLAAAQPATVRYPSSGVAVEVDIAHQVVLVSRGGTLLGVLDTSTGSDRLYVSDGVTYRATTPRGHYSVTWKFDGVRVSRLGQLYRPAYFVQGWAIHGNGSVPNYPASHGCVRVTDLSMDWLFPMLPVGAPVTLYDH